MAALMHSIRSIAADGAENCPMTPAQTSSLYCIQQRSGYLASINGLGLAANAALPFLRLQTREPLPLVVFMCVPH